MKSVFICARSRVCSAECLQTAAARFRAYLSVFIQLLGYSNLQQITSQQNTHLKRRATAACLKMKVEYRAQVGYWTRNRN